MSKTDQIYNQLVNDILENGIWDKDQNVRTKWADGTPAHTKSIIGRQLHFDGTEVPILTTKYVPPKTPIIEALWFFVGKTSDCSYLDEHNVKIWKEWANADNHIGKSYGYQAGKKVRQLNGAMVDQIDYLIHQLRHNPASRRHMTTWWNIDDLDQMELEPCWHSTQWLVKAGKLHLIVTSRSADVFLGLPFNIYQYYVVLRAVAQVTNLEVGTMTCNLGDVHIYDRHIDIIQEQMALPGFQAPTLWVNPNVKEMNDFTIEDFKLVDYKHGPKLKAEVAI
ncbi:thymidylate synthase [Hazenella sp. IB182357]|uniref:Thymidylate synthase n=1 Tax=Polycladospora coralii TaxID=2771432 RepID=A0A926NA79_9BACL|nr:thymidylate synthase [Polycladospora coralii]MBD1372698.1 thymidylate synthase [Polycladospora coralii]